MSRFLATGIGKFSEPNEVESMEMKAIDKEDYLYKVAIIFDHVIGYAQHVPNPKMLYYKYRGPVLDVELSSGREVSILCDFNRFDEAYFKHYTEKTIMIKPN